MNLLRRAFAVGLALLCSSTLAFIVLPLGILFDPQIIGSDPAGLAAKIVAGILQAGDPERLAASVSLVWTAMMTVCALPLVITGLAGEVARVRSWLWYAAGTGFVSAGLPLLIRLGIGSPGTGRQADIATQALEHRLLLLFFLTGVISGTLYWLIAGRTAGGMAVPQLRRAP